MKPFQVSRQQCADLALGEAIDDAGLFHVAFAIVGGGNVKAECVLRPADALGFGLIVIYRSLKGLLLKR